MKNLVLLIDDDDDECIILEMMLQSCVKDSHVHQVTEYKHAVTFADTHPAVPNLIFLDLRMPTMSGWEILPWIRGHNRLREVPVVVWSHAASDEDIERSHQQGGNYFLSKTADSSTLSSAVQDICHNWLQ